MPKMNKSKKFKADNMDAKEVKFMKTYGQMHPINDIE